MRSAAPLGLPVIRSYRSSSGSPDQKRRSKLPLSRRVATCTISFWMMVAQDQTEARTSSAMTILTVSEARRNSAISEKSAGAPIATFSMLCLSLDCLGDCLCPQFRGVLPRS